MNVTAQVSRRIPAGPDRVWKTLTSKAGMKAYMMGADVETDWRPGHPIIIKGEVNGRGYRDHGEVRSYDPGHSFSYTHQSGRGGPVHLVKFELMSNGPDTYVTVKQSNENGTSEPDRHRREEYERTWSRMLEGVEKAVRSNGVA